MRSMVKRNMEGGIEKNKGSIFEGFGGWDGSERGDLLERIRKRV